MKDGGHCLGAQAIDAHIGGRHVLKGLSLEVSSGEIVGLLGPNGSGKSTAFNVITGLRRASRGTITLDGKDLSGEAFGARAAAGIIYLPQEHSVFQTLSVTDNILAVLEVRQRQDREQNAAEAERLLRRFKLDGLRRQASRSLSGGERRRLEMARAMAMQPKFMLLDEPFAAIDPLSVKDLKGTILELRDSGQGILITDHNFRDVLDICDHCHVLSNGEIIARGDAGAISASERVRDLYTG